MDVILADIAGSYDPATAGLALALCVAGSLICMRLFARVRRTEGVVKTLWLFLSGTVGGATIWATQLISMVAYRQPAPYGFEPVPAILALACVVAVTMFGFFVAAKTKRSALIETGGLVIGVGMVAMQVLAMTALEVAGAVSWDRTFAVAAAMLACLFGAIAANRIARPVTRFCKYGGALSFLLAIVLLQAVGMAGVTILPRVDAEVPLNTVSGSLLTAGVVSIAVALLSTATASYLIDRRTSEETGDRLEQLALHDPLTGLANRTGFEARLVETLTRGADDTARVCIAMFDLSRFREVNDVYGHAAGDAMLKAVSQRMSDVLRPGEFIARFSGNRFLAFRYPVYRARDAEDFCGRLCDACRSATQWQGQHVEIEARAGFALHPDDGATSAELLERAELALHRAKASVAGRVAAYHREVDQVSRTRSTLAMDLQKAIAADELELAFQGQNDAATRKLLGFEVLLRWNHPRLGRVPPDQFIRIAEETGQIGAIGAWVLREACREAASWAKPYKVAVNIAAAQLASPDLPAQVHQTLLETGLSPARLELEITETGIIGDSQHALHVIRQLKALGIAIAMDDFGTGYSSLATLRNFPFGKIKIDREFIRDIDSNEQSAAIVRATIILGQSLGIPVLAEGVETEDHLEILRREGCREVQGYLFGKPIPLSEVRAITGRKEVASPQPVAPRDRPAAGPVLPENKVAVG